jgi:hypothetical protein
VGQALATAAVIPLVCVLRVESSMLNLKVKSVGIWLLPLIGVGSIVLFISSARRRTVHQPAEEILQPSPAVEVDLERALVSPASVFLTPEKVVTNSLLTTQEKLAILLQWEIDELDAGTTAGSVILDRLAQARRVVTAG